MSAHPSYRSDICPKTWGRSVTSSLTSFCGCLALFVLSPFTVLYFYIAAFHFDGSLQGAYQALMQGKIWEFLPTFQSEAALLFTLWVIFQIGLALMPDQIHKWIKRYQGGKVEGAITPAGNRLSYQINGLQAWVITHVMFLIATLGFGWFSPATLLYYWGSLFWVVNLVGFTLAIFVYAKAIVTPTHREDRKFSGSLLYDFFMGIELNPRIGNFDLKLFFNGRPGIVAWTLINLSFAAAQYSRYGLVTNSMWIVNLLQGLYVLYFFWKEAWYLKTIDIHHDHFGWMLAWGDCVWLPYMYTLQALFLVFNPVELSTGYALFVLFFGLAGFYIFASANNQKDRFRRDPHALIWGKKPTSISCEYITQDGALRRTELLTSGWWGVSRHMNYTGDLVLSLAYSLACGTKYFYPYFYFFFLSGLLIHRCLRDEERCQLKYGAAWRDYCRQVPSRLLPQIW